MIDNNNDDIYNDDIYNNIDNIDYKNNNKNNNDNDNIYNHIDNSNNNNNNNDNDDKNNNYYIKKYDDEYNDEYKYNDINNKNFYKIYDIYNIIKNNIHKINNKIYKNDINYYKSRSKNFNYNINDQEIILLVYDFLSVLCNNYIQLNDIKHFHNLMFIFDFFTINNVNKYIKYIYRDNINMILYALSLNNENNISMTNFYLYLSNYLDIYKNIDDSELQLNSYINMLCKYIIQSNIYYKNNIYHIDKNNIYPKYIYNKNIIKNINSLNNYYKNVITTIDTYNNNLFYNNGNFYYIFILQFTKYIILTRKINNYNFD
jgi:hypothetical protein